MLCWSRATSLANVLEGEGTLCTLKRLLSDNALADWAVTAA
jgi:hypothetical protein